MTAARPFLLTGLLLAALIAAALAVGAQGFGWGEAGSLALLRGPRVLAAQHAEAIKKGSLVRLVCGEEDETFANNRDFHEHLERLAHHPDHAPARPRRRLEGHKGSDDAAADPAEAPPVSPVHPEPEERLTHRKVADAERRVGFDERRVREGAPEPLDHRVAGGLREVREGDPRGSAVEHGTFPGAARGRGASAPLRKRDRPKRPPANGKARRSRKGRPACPL